MRIVQSSAVDADMSTNFIALYGFPTIGREIRCVDGYYTFEMFFQGTTSQPKTIREALLEQIEATRERDKDIAWDCFLDNK